MDSAAFLTLQALLLALSHPDVVLSETEKDKLFEVGEQLELDPDDWEFIYNGLIHLIFSNPTLKPIFETEVAILSDIPDNLKLQLLPTATELEQAFSIGVNIEKRGYVEGKPDLESQEILNLSRKILKEEDPADTVKKLSWIKRIKTMFY